MTTDCLFNHFGEVDGMVRKEKECYLKIDTSSSWHQERDKINF